MKKILLKCSHNLRFGSSATTLMAKAGRAYIMQAPTYTEDDMITATPHDHQDIVIHLPLDCLFSSLRKLTSKENIKTVLLWRESTCPGWFPSQRAQKCEKCFHLMTSSYVEGRDWPQQWDYWKHHRVFVMPTLLSLAEVFMTTISEATVG